MVDRRLRPGDPRSMFRFERVWPQYPVIRSCTFDDHAARVLTLRAKLAANEVQGKEPPRKKRLIRRSTPIPAEVFEGWHLCVNGIQKEFSPRQRVRRGPSSTMPHRFCNRGKRRATGMISLSSWQPLRSSVWRFPAIPWWRANWRPPNHDWDH